MGSKGQVVGRAEVMRVRTSLGERGEEEVRLWMGDVEGEQVVSVGMKWRVKDNSVLALVLCLSIGSPRCVGQNTT